MVFQYKNMTILKPLKNNKMRTFLIISTCILLFNYTAYAQLQEVFLEKKTDVAEYATYENIEHIVSDLIAEGHFTDYKPEGNYLEDFHLIDFNADGLKDVLFNGSVVGGESKVILLFLNTGEAYTSILDLQGKIVWMQQKDKYSPFHFGINHYGCCASINDVLEFYTPLKLGNEFKYVVSQKIAMIKETILPANDFIDPIAFKTVNPEYHLRSTPQIDNENKDGRFRDYNVKGNILATYPPESVGTAIAKKTDSTGRVWYFVVMKNNTEPLTELFSKGVNNNRSYYSVGWMSSNYLKEL